MYVLMAKWDKITEEWKVEDRRWTPMAAVGGISLVGIVVVLAVWYFIWPDQAIEVLTGLQENTQIVQQQEQDNNSDFTGKDNYEVFVSKVIWSTNTLWSSVFQTKWYTYKEPKVVLFRGATQSSCGGAVSQIWPHYCPIDQTIYIDETFFTTLEKQFGAKWGDLSQAYVLAHEVWHHVQHQLWLTDKAQQRREQWDSNASIALELQADCLAGVWIGAINDEWVLEENDLYEAIDAAEAVGDDNIQKKTAWYVQPETRTHGSSEQRKKRLFQWYTKKSLSACMVE